MSNVAQKIFEKNNINVDVKTGLSEEEIIKIIPEYDGMVVRSATKVTKKIILAGKKLKAIARAGAGVDNIDVPAAKENNMIVMNTPGGNANATAEHTFALIMSVLRKIPFSNENLKIVEDWINKSNTFKFMCEDKNLRSSTSITVLIKDEWFTKFNEEEQRGVLKKLFSVLDKEGVANDINGYPKAPPSIIIW